MSRVCVDERARWVREVVVSKARALWLTMSSGLHGRFPHCHCVHHHHLAPHCTAPDCPTDAL